MKLMLDEFRPNMGFKSTAKNYKYFFRGQYDLIPEPSDVISSMQSKKQKLQKYEKLLKQFAYKDALTSAIEQGNTEVVVALIEELMQRNGLDSALGQRSPE